MFHQGQLGKMMTMKASARVSTTQTHRDTTLQVDLGHATYTQSHPRIPDPHFHTLLLEERQHGWLKDSWEQQQMGHEDQLAMQTCQSGIRHAFSLQQIQIQYSPILYLLYIQVPLHTNEYWGSLSIGFLQPAKL